MIFVNRVSSGGVPEDSNCGMLYMKKTNNKYRNNNSGQIYSLNYKFDSNSIAGKFSGTALDLIKKYNELAKEAHLNNDYVTAEVFRQYAEHYRKIVTEINEKKQVQNQNQKVVSFPKNAENSLDEKETAIEGTENMKSVDTLLSEPAGQSVEKPVEEAASVEKRAFKVIEITPETSKAEIITAAEARPRTRRPRKKVEKESLDNNENKEDELAV